jgi:hypothetical protein
LSNVSYLLEGKTVGRPDTRYIGPVTGIEIYKNDVRVLRKGLPNDQTPHERGEIAVFTRASRKRLAFVAANTETKFRTMVTLTYPKVWPTDGRQVKRDLREFLSKMRRVSWGCDYLWFLEFQRRGAPHVHILTDYPLPQDQAELSAYRKHLAWMWYDIAKTGDQKHLLAGTRVERLRSAEGGARYAVKYAAKMVQKIVPPEYRNVGRFWGHTKAVKPQALKRVRCTEDDIRAVLEGWEHAPNDDAPVYKTVYNQAHRFLGWIDGLDNDDLKAYNRAKHDSSTNAYETE